MRGEATAAVQSHVDVRLYEACIAGTGQDLGGPELAACLRHAGLALEELGEVVDGQTPRRPRPR